MDSFDPARYGDDAVGFYDQLYAAVDARQVACLAALAHGGSALDLGVGTGRVAVPLRRLGIPVHGIDASRAMLDALAARPGGADIATLHGDFSSASLGAAPHALIYSLVSTIFLLPSLPLQQACLANIARHLACGGVFVSEGFRDEGAFPSPRTEAVPVFTSRGIETYRVTMLVPPLDVFDAMAARAGLRLWQRWCDWSRTPYRPGQARHVSVYTRADAPHA